MGPGLCGSAPRGQVAIFVRYRTDALQDNAFNGDIGQPMADKPKSNSN
jgi:hypothetical protein